MRAPGDDSSRPSEGGPGGPTTPGVADGSGTLGRPRSQGSRPPVETPVAVPVDASIPASIEAPVAVAVDASIEAPVAVAVDASIEAPVAVPVDASIEPSIAASIAAPAEPPVAAPARRWYFDDFQPGQEIDLGERTVTEAEILAFARAFDPQPFHIDAGAAAASPFGGLIASGWHTCSMMMRMVVDGLLAESAGMGSPGLDGVRWLQPVRAGDTLRVRYVTRRVKVSTSKPDRGVVWSTWIATNQHGVEVCTVDGMGLYRRRPAGAA